MPVPPVVRPFLVLPVLAVLVLAVAACDAPPEQSAGEQPAGEPPAGEPPPAEPAAAEPPPAMAVEAPDAPRASRSFFGPHTYPPQAFAAYGIVAFPETAVATTRERHLMACRAYVATLPKPGELSVAPTAQMVTVWPVDSDETAVRLMAMPGEEPCAEAVAHYHLPTALQAIAQASRRHPLRDGAGPYLFAWAPASAKGDPDAPVLVADLSTAATQTQFNERFRGWRTDIEGNPQLWRNGWSLAELRAVVRAWADTYGPAVLRFWEG